MPINWTLLKFLLLIVYYLIRLLYGYLATDLLRLLKVYLKLRLIKVKRLDKPWHRRIHWLIPNGFVMSRPNFGHTGSIPLDGWLLPLNSFSFGRYLLDLALQIIDRVLDLDVEVLGPHLIGILFALEQPLRTLGMELGRRYELLLWRRKRAPVGQDQL